MNFQKTAFACGCFQWHAEGGRPSGLGRRGRMPDAAQNLRTGPASGAHLQVLAPGHAARFPGRRADHRHLSDGLAKQTVELFVGENRAGTHSRAAQRLKNLFLLIFPLLVRINTYIYIYICVHLCFF